MLNSPQSFSGISVTGAINMAKGIKFTNYTKDDFTWKYDGEPHTFAPGEFGYFDEPIARHFAHHLACKVMHSMKDAKGADESWLNQDPKFVALVEKSLGDTVEAVDETTLKSKMTKKNIETKSKSKKEEEINPEFEQ